VVPFHLAQVNIARPRAPLDDPLMADFAARLAEINALAESSPGFVWRFKDEVYGAIYLQVFGDDRLLFNMSVWESAEALKDYVYRSAHREPLARRHEWFEKRPGASLAMWWIPAGTIPTVEDSRERLDHLAEHGPTPFAFTFRETFPPPASADPAASRDFATPRP
jgi:heme-degrading monooxygenase HmoA